jgi:hypothetical protein
MRTSRLGRLHHCHNQPLVQEGVSCRRHRTFPWTPKRATCYPTKHDFISHVSQPKLSPGAGRGFFSLSDFLRLAENRAGCGLTPYGRRERPSQIPGIPMPCAAASPPSRCMAAGASRIYEGVEIASGDRSAVSSRWCLELSWHYLQPAQRTGEWAREELRHGL